MNAEVLTALSEIIPLPSSVVLVETLAARRAILFIKELDLHSSIFEGDSAISINALRSNNLPQSSFGHIVKDILSSVSSLQSFSFSYTLRQGNVLAHVLTKRARLSFLMYV